MPAQSYTTSQEERLAGFGQISQPVLPLLEALQLFMNDQSCAFEPEVRDLVHRSLRNQGKRIRPVLLFASAGAPRSDKTTTQQLVKAAAVIEMVHLATLVHDDILDAASIRHGETTINTEYGNNVAVLLGDALFAQALKLASEFPTTSVCRAVAESTRRVCAGEISQTFARGNVALSRTAYFRMIELKTAELFAVACQLGAEIGGLTPEHVASSTQFGRHLGTAYQIFDDAADFLGDENKIGKTLGTDLQSGKYTLPMLLLWEEESEADRLEWKTRFDNEQVTFAELMLELERKAVWQRVRAAFDAEMQSARKALLTLEDSPSGTILQAVTDFLQSHVNQLFASRIE